MMLIQRGRSMEITNQETVRSVQHTYTAPVCKVGAVEMSGSVHRYIAGPSFRDTGLMLCSAAFACREEERPPALLEFFDFSPLVCTFGSNDIFASSSLYPGHTPTTIH
jgi:hypothetical protein